MRVVLQVVKNASVSIDEKVYSQINEGFLLLVGFNNKDNEEVVRKVIDKIISLRVFMDENGVIFGCDECCKKKSAWETEECF